MFDGPDKKPVKKSNSLFIVLIFIVFRCCMSGFSFSHFVQWLKPKLSQESEKNSRENSITKKREKFGFSKRTENLAKKFIILNNC